MNPNELKAFTSTKRFSATRVCGGTPLEIEVVTPDLSDITPSVWGAWGPVYTFAFDEPRIVSVICRGESSLIENEIEIPVSKVYLDSPLLADRRQEHPLYMRFRDASRGLEFHCYLDQGGEPGALEVQQFMLGEGLNALILMHPPQPQSSGQAMEHAFA